MVARSKRAGRRQRFGREKAPRAGEARIDSLNRMKTFLVMMIGGALGSGVASGQVLDTAKEAAKTTAETAKEAGQTVVHGAKKAVNKVADALTPDADARRVDVTVTDDKIDMPTDLEPGKTAFVVKNEGKTTPNFEIAGGSIDRKFIAPPGPGETKVLHATLKRGTTYSVYSTNADGGKRTRKMTLHVK